MIEWYALASFSSRAISVLSFERFMFNCPFVRVVLVFRGIISVDLQGMLIQI